MITTIILRFRDILADTVVEHKQVLESAGEVWWGWWKKKDEPDRLRELAELEGRCKKGPLKIGLFDRSRERYFASLIVQCVFSATGNSFSTPDELRTPAYYGKQTLPAWFRITEIEEITQKAFTELFSGVPLEDYTFFPVIDRPDGASLQESSLIKSEIALKGSSVIHLSDIHFGSDFGYGASAEPGSHPLMPILERDIKKTVGNDVGLLVVSGDTTSRGDASHLFNVAIPFLEQLRLNLGLEREHVIIVPGNHDISFKDFSLQYDHEAAFNAFLDRFYGTPQKPISLRRFRLPNGRSVEILPLNSVKLRTKETSNYGWVDWQSYESILENTQIEPDTLRMSVIHHHLVPTLREERLPDCDYEYASVSLTLNAAALIEGLQRNKFKVVLHGHQHTPALNTVSRGRYCDNTLELEGYQDPMYVIAGGSTGVELKRIDGDIRDNTYGILKIDGKDSRLSVRQFNPTGSVRTLYGAALNLS